LVFQQLSIPTIASSNNNFFPKEVQQQEEFFDNLVSELCCADLLNKSERLEVGKNMKAVIWEALLH
jgi:hypothetical protein